MAAVMPLRVGVLGPVCAWHALLGSAAAEGSWDRDGTEEELELGQPRQLAVLGLLAVRANRVVSRAEVIDAVWGDQPPASAESGVYTYVAGLRRVLEPGRQRGQNQRGQRQDGQEQRGQDRGRSRRESDSVLVSVGGGYMLRLAPAGLDAVAFERGLARCRGMRAAGDLVGADEVLASALGLWRGEAFTGVPGPFADAERLRLSELRTAAAEDRGDLLLATGRAAEAVAALTALVAEHPLRERPRALLMIALYRTGRQAHALQVFQDARARLAEDLGIDPGNELSHVHQQVLTMDPALGGMARQDQPAFLAAPVADPPIAGGVAVAPAPAGGAGGPAAPRAGEPAGPVPAQIPPEVAGFAGRATELRRLHQLLDATENDSAGMPVVVIAGTAGVGKTALAVRFAREAATRFPDGQLYVNLRGFDPSGAPADPGTALRGFLESLGVLAHQLPASMDAQTGLLRSLLDGKRVLLLIDNARTASQVRPLLPGSPGCMVVVTSRDQLAGLVASEGALLLPLDVLSEEESRELLAARLGQRRVSAEPAAVAELIRQSARLPLALSVASARAVTRPGITLADLVAELRDARVRLDALEAGDVATDLRAVFSWSLAWLSDPAARMFRLLGMVTGDGIRVPVAASLAGVSWPAARAALAELCRASLLAEDEDGRYGCHDLLRAYAAEQARLTDGEAAVDAAQLRLFDHYLRTAYNAMLTVYPARPRIELPSPLPGVSPERPDEYEDVIGWFRAEQDALLAAAALAGDRGARDHNRDMDVYCWQIGWSCSPMLMRLGEYPGIAAASRAGLAAAERLGDLNARGQVHNDLGYAYTRLGEFAEADLHLRRALEIFTVSGDWAGVGLAHHGLTVLLDEQGRYADALPHAQEALRLRSSFGDRAGVAYAENTVGWIYANLGQHAEALWHCQRALELHLESGVRSGAADTLDSIGFAYAGLGDLEQAIVHYRRAVEMFQEIGDPRGEWQSLIHLGDAHLTLHQAGDARQSWERALALVTVTPGGDSTPIRDRMARLASVD
jgi:DNA-binding SARP family transcriptional activator/Flp pilus assembly protein TadD